MARAPAAQREKMTLVWKAAQIQNTPRHCAAAPFL
jgi:hypothetical protein